MGDIRVNEFQPGVIQPGMERLVEAGETLEITDNAGQVFAITGIEGPSTVEFCISFDNWLTMKKADIQGPVIATAFSDLVEKFGNLPMRVQRQMPSFKSLGVRT